MMNAYMTLAIAALLTLPARPTQADFFTPSHACYRPQKPYQFDSEEEVQRYKDQVEDYRHCINDFIEEQQDAARKHQDAAQEAMQEWNDFVNFDQPWSSLNPKKNPKAGRSGFAP
jgi:hypothetical protein